jgi:cytochrome c
MRQTDMTRALSLPFFNLRNICLAMLAAGAVSHAATIAEVVQQIDAAAGNPKDTTTEFAIDGIVAGRLVRPDHQVFAFILNPGEAGVTVLASGDDAAKLVPRNEVKISGKLAATPLGAALQATAGSVTVLQTNKPFSSVPVGADLFKEATASAGRYVQLTNVTFAAGKFDASGLAKAKAADGTEVSILIGQGAAGHDVPPAAVDIFGVPVKTEAGWQLAAARFLAVNRQEAQALAMKHTCLTCHNPDTKIIGPPYREVAAKYRNDSDAMTKVIAQMENGGSGKWGPVPMLPFKGKVPPEDMKRLGEWVLGFRWDALLAE